MYESKISAYLLMILVLSIILFGSLLKKNVRRRNSCFFTASVISTIVMLIAAILAYFSLDKMAQGQNEYLNLYRVFECLNLVCYFGNIALFVCYVVDFLSKYKKISSFYKIYSVIVCAFCAFIWCSSVFNGSIFYVENGKFIRGPYYGQGLLGGYSISIVLFLLLVRHVKTIGLHDTVVLLTFVLFPLSSIALRPIFPQFSLQLAVSISIILIFNFIYLNQIQLISQQEIKLAENRIELMINQIRPHFIFNVLNSIYVLCDKDPPEGRRAIGNFANYLRGNLYAAKNLKEVTFEKELFHLEYYLNLEKMRFQDEINFEFDIKERNFKIPPMILQPLVENAIRHGIGKKKEGGKILITSEKKEKFILIKIIDDGPGFDTNLLNEEDDSLHLGLANVKERLEMMCKGELEIHSEIGKGTEVEIKIPLTNLIGEENESSGSR
ncbi:MAG: histidine kinase [Treponema sp.]|nr:histidine kinase [Treponema sp.]